jgi:hypothetical protein
MSCMQTPIRSEWSPKTGTQIYRTISQTEIDFAVDMSRSTVERSLNRNIETSVIKDVINVSISSGEESDRATQKLIVNGRL